MQLLLFILVAGAYTIPSVWTSIDECPYIGVPEGTNRTSDDVVKGTKVEYRCLEIGSTFNDGDFIYKIQCLSSGKWSKLPHPCIPMRCPSQPLIHHSTVSTLSTLSGVAVTYRCMYGYSFPDAAASKVITCDPETQTWVTAAIDTLSNMTCDIQYCEGRPTNYSTVVYDGLDAYTENNTIAIGSTITAYCLEGYERSSGTILASGKCAASKRLDGSYESCNIRQCPVLTPPWNSDYRFLKNSYKQNSLLYCKVGVFPGGKSYHRLRCDNNGQWIKEPSDTGCLVGTCEDGWIKYNKHCYFISDPKAWGLRYYYAEETCVYKKSHLAYINSTEEGRYLYTQTYAKSGRDYWIGYHYDKVAEQWAWFGNKSIAYTRWHRGYPELHESCGRLSVNGVWKDRNCDDLMPYICKKPTMCDSPPVITNGGPDTHVIPKLMDVGDSLTYKCDPGFWFRSDRTTERLVECLPETFYSPIENCQQVMCPPLNRLTYVVRNAAIVGSQANTYLSNVTWTCNTGYIFPDGEFSKEITCLPDGTWSSVPDMCIKVYCPVPGILNAIPMNSSNDVASADIYTCKPGFEFTLGETERTMVCQSDGTWIPSGSCWRRRCQPYFQYRGNITDGTTEIARYGEKIEITCDIGYQFPDGKEVKKTTCGPEYHWEPYLPLCEPKTCPGGTPPPVPNATPNTTIGIIETVVKYTCNDSHTFIDGDTERIAYCDLETQQWIGVPNECLSSVQDPAKNIVGGGRILSTITAVAAIGCIVIVMWLIVCSDCNEDRQIIPVCNNCQSEKDEDEEEDSDDDSESTGQEPVRLQMVA